MSSELYWTDVSVTPDKVHYSVSWNFQLLVSRHHFATLSLLSLYIFELSLPGFFHEFCYHSLLQCWYSKVRPSTHISSTSCSSLSKSIFRMLAAIRGGCTLQSSWWYYSNNAPIPLSSSEMIPDTAGHLHLVVLQKRTSASCTDLNPWEQVRVSKNN